MATTDAKLRLIIQAQDNTGNIFAAIAAKAQEAATNLGKASEALGSVGTNAETGAKMAREAVEQLASSVSTSVSAISNSMTLLKPIDAPLLLPEQATSDLEMRATRFDAAITRILISMEKAKPLLTPDVIGLGAGTVALLLPEKATSELQMRIASVDRMISNSVLFSGPKAGRGLVDERKIPDTILGEPPKMLGPGGGGGQQAAGGGAEAEGVFTNLGNGARAAGEAVRQFGQTISITREQAQQMVGVLAAKTDNMHILEQATGASNAKLGEFLTEVTGVTTSVGEAIPQLTMMEKVMALQGLAQASDMIKGWGENILGFLREGIQLSMQFEQTTVELQGALAINQGLFQPANNTVANWQALGGTMGALSDKATELGKAYMFNENQAQEMFYQLASSGIPAKAIMDGVGKSTMELAQATRSDLIPTTHILTSVWHQMGDSVKVFGTETKDQMSGVSDVLTNVKLSTGESLQSIANTMKYVGPIANSSGQSFVDLGASIALLGRNGIEASQAGTALRRMLTNLTPQSKEAATAMSDLGIITADGTNQFFTASGKMKPMNDIIGILNKSVQGLGDEQKNAALKSIFGQYALQSMMVVAKTSQKDFEDLSGKIGQSGTASELSGQQMQTLAGKMDVFTENWTIIKKKIGDALETALKPLIDVFISITDKVITFMQTHPEVVKWIATFAGIVGVVMVVVGAVGGFIATVGLFATALEAGSIALGLTGLSLGAFLGPVALVVAAVVALYFAFQTNFGGIRDFVTAIWTRLKTDTLAAWEYIKPTVQNAIDLVWAFIKQFADDIGRILKWILDTLSGMRSTWEMLWNAIKLVLQAAWDFITSVIRGAFEIIKGIWNVVMGLLTGDWDRFWEGIRGIVDGAFRIIAAQIKLAWDTIMTVIYTVVGTILSFFDNKFGTNLVGLFTGYFNNLKDSIDRLWDSICNLARGWGRNLLAMFGAGIKAGLSGLIQDVKDAAEEIKKNLGFSSPTEEGPASNSDEWAPNFMKMFAGGIRDHKDKVRSAMGEVAMDMRTTVGIEKGGLPAASSPTRGVAAPVFNITINSQGRGGDDLAKEFVDAIRRYVPVVTVS